MGKFGISYFELLLMFEVDSGHRLLVEKNCSSPPPSPQTSGFFFGFPVGVGQEIRHGCQFLHSLFRILDYFPGGLARLIPCQPSVHYARLSHGLGAVWTWSLFSPP